MLSAEDNELITRVGPGTPMGALMRQYWVPALLAKELPERDGPPVRVLLLGEKLIAFRDSEGRVGLLDHACPHRGASLFWGRNEDCGIRCVYHGWKFAVDGTCLDMPNEPAESTFKDRVRATAYPCVEAGGVVWTYMGPRAQPPPMPHFEWFDAAPEDVHAHAYQTGCNWLQAFEGDMDASHVAFLHMGQARAEDAPEGSFLQMALRDRAPRINTVDAEYGVTFGAERAADPGNTFWWICHFLFPFYCMTPPGVLGRKAATLCKVPMDDTHTLSFQMGLKSSYVTNADKSPGLKSREYDGRDLLPNGTGWLDRFRWQPNIDNDYLVDRERQRRGESYTGITGFVLEDVAIAESQGPVLDRTKERLGASDVMLIRTRRRLLAAARALAADGSVPPGVDHPEVYLQRSGGVVLPSDADWWEATAELRRGGVEHADLSTSVLGGL